MPKLKNSSPLFVAIDTENLDQARQWAVAVAPVTGAIKLGLQFFVHHGPDGVRHVLRDLDVALFLDLKLHDIPNTVAGAVRSAAALAPTFITIHTSGGADMMLAAREAAMAASKDHKIARPRILGVTVLTSLNDDDMRMMGHMTPTTDQVRRYAMLAQENKIDGLVCSPQELRELRTLCGEGMILVCPGIRPLGSKKDDQKRTLTPAEAMANGANYMVMGRPITGADDPAKFAKDVLASLK